jgi:hypothetical protein
MRKRKAKAPKLSCTNCDSTAAPVKARFRSGGKCRVCPDCRALATHAEA